MSTLKLFWNITWRAAIGIFAAAWLAQAFFAMLFAGFGYAATVINPAGRTLSPAYVLQALLAVFVLTLVGGVAGGFFSLPVGLFLGVSSGLLVSVITRLFFYPLRDASLYRRSVSLVLFVYSTLGSWVGFMALYLLISRDHTFHSPLVPGLALLAALIAGGCALVVARWIARGYIMTSQAHSS